MTAVLKEKERQTKVFWGEWDLNCIEFAEESSVMLLHRRGVDA